MSRATGAGGMNREEAPGKSPEDMYIQQKVRVLLMLKKMGSNVSTLSWHTSLGQAWKQLKVYYMVMKKTSYFIFIVILRC